MKLLTRTSIYYFISSLLVFVIGGFIFYNVIQSIFYKQLDDTLITEKKLIEEQINYSDSLPDFRTVFGHMIQVTVFNDRLKKSEKINDTIIASDDRTELISCRHLHVTNTSISNRGYIIHIFKPIGETKNLITAILLAMTFLFISLMGLLLLVNYYISKRVWIPFYRTLRSLSHYNINQEEPLHLTKTRISEFRLLNKALENMSIKIRRDFLNLKEFTENASHELQTPLAIIKSKLELLVQSEQLTVEQMQLIHSVYDAVTRISKLNQGLLLISKIENNQFSAVEKVDLQKIILRNLENFEDAFRMKNISTRCQCNEPVILSMNRSLAEILVSNLISNAVKHNVDGGNLEVLANQTNLRISNTGHSLSISPQRLFERFSKSDRTSESVGLGLAIVRQIANLYRMQVEYRYENQLHTIIVSFPFPDSEKNKSLKE